jgi:tetratricopeptide (TPR) repeat protein
LKKDYANALADFNKLIKLQAENSAGYRLRGDVHLRVGTLARQLGRPDPAGDPLDFAIADYSEAIRLNPKDAAAYRQRACAYAAKGNMDQALAGLTEALRLDPKDAEALCDRAEVYAGMERRDLAEANYKAALRLQPAHERSAKGLVALTGEHTTPPDLGPLRSDEVRIYRQSG